MKKEININKAHAPFTIFISLKASLVLLFSTTIFSKNPVERNSQKMVVRPIHIGVNREDDRSAELTINDKFNNMTSIID